MHLQKTTCTTLLATFITLSAPTWAWAMSSVQSDQPCQVQYFAPEDHLHKTPHAKPHPAFLQDYARALKGNAVSQRNVAIYFESGHLVAECTDKAAFWYEKAAKGGDDASQKWMERRKRFQEMAAGPECTGDQCNGHSDDAAQMMSLASDPRGHFYTELTINGVTKRGLIDTGASSIALSVSDAAAMGISFQDSRAGKAETANGTITTLNKILPRVKIGIITLTDVSVSISANNGLPLIGMSALRRLKINAAGGQMTLTK